MTSAIIITVCALLLIAYVFDLSASKTKIPSVILLLLLGWIVRQLSGVMNIHIPDLSPLLPILGTVGLILIVLEGSLELELDQSKKKLIAKPFWVAFLSILTQAFILAILFKVLGYSTLKNGLVNVLPFCIISSAVAIPTVKHITASTKEFVIYESSLSDILGILFFNFVAINSTIGVHSFIDFIGQLIVIVIISFIATLALSFLLSKIDHHIKFVPIILLVILIYEVAKEYELPSLIFIVFFGLFLGNIDKLKQFKWIRKIHTNNLHEEVRKFRELSTEAAFLIRALFFLLFGYLIETTELLNTQTLLWALLFVVAIFGIRAILLKILKLPLQPLLYIAPRGLITILLFLSIVPAQKIAVVNKSLIIQVIIFTTLFMMIGMMRKNKGERRDRYGG
ncbi:MAG: cation:proton antiporter [Ferruginibacter sp.]